MQFDQGEKGFSFSKEGPLDMRMDPSMPLSAKEVVNRFSEEEIGKIFKEYGEEPRWRQAAKAIVHARRKSPIETTKQLAEIISQAIGKAKKHLHPATLIFQALRICVNQELESVKSALPKAINWLASHGRMGVISFHRLEDSIVKSLFKEASRAPSKREKGNFVPPLLHLVTKKPIVASEEERRFNPRSRSAKLRFAEKL
ncbi:MAG TPA: 16S rRNA (cytosine(1402)-N(4))-methyltransferase RsmH [Rhabdochlamydiaceae bacterium]|nr:16S rRNA (cytosine(1402)-N(4))-methyltransferase RsmH [Rhabdochlamydiaceae bacterium]